MELVGFLVIGPLLALIPAFIAKRKKHGFWTFYIFGFLLWIVALPVALLIKDKRRHCRFCVEPIAEEASVCPHCRKELPSAPHSHALGALQ
jgi:hypothetical protein